LAMFQSLTRDSNHSNVLTARHVVIARQFQSLTRDSNHSNHLVQSLPVARDQGFNPSRGIAIIQTVWQPNWQEGIAGFQSLTRDSNHSNEIARDLKDYTGYVSIPHAG